MKAYEFKHEMATTSAIFGRELGAYVTFEGEQAFTDGKRINLPSLGLNTDLTVDQVKAMRGYVDHEAGHLRHSDMERLMKWYPWLHENGYGVLKDIHNCVEDVWMENQVTKVYPGSYKNLKQTNEMVKSRELELFDKPETKDTIVDGLNPLSVCLGIKAANPMYLGNPSSYSEQVMDRFTEEQREWFHMWAKQAQECESTEDCITLAKSIYKMLLEEHNPEQPMPEDQQTQPGDFDGEAGKEMFEGESDGKGGRGTQEGEGKGGEGEGEGEGNPAPGEWEKLPDDYLPEVEEVMTSDSGGHDGAGSIGGCEGPLKGGYRVYSTENDVVYKRGTNMPAYAEKRVVDLVNSTDHHKYEEVKGNITSEINLMKTKLKRALMAKQQRDWDPGRLDGRLDSKRLVSASRGTPTVFKRRIDREDEDTAITFLTDLSGSMGGRKAVVTRDCSVALSECMEGSSMPFKVVGFCNKGYPASGEGSGMYHRYERTDTVVFKDFGVSLRKCRASIGKLDDAVGGNNSDYDFVAQELYHLSKRDEKRKVLFVLSDGHPACHTDANISEHIRHLKDSIAHARRQGIECVGIGICDSAVKEIYDDYVVVNDVHDLAATVFNKLTRILVK